jgi:hypothetical protein
MGAMGAANAVDAVGAEYATTVCRQCGERPPSWVRRVRPTTRRTKQRRARKQTKRKRRRKQNGWWAALEREADAGAAVPI